MAPLALKQSRPLSLIIVVGAVAAFAAVSRPTHLDAVAEPVRPPAPPSEPGEQGPPSWALATPSDTDDGALPGDTVAGSIITGKVLEQLDVAKYSYLRLGAEGRLDTWVAVPATPSRVGQSVTVQNAEQMSNFVSASLKRTFDVIYFGVLDTSTVVSPLATADPAVVSPTDDPHQAQSAPHPGPGKAADAIPVAKSERAPGPLGHTVAELNAFEHAAAGTRARVRATVVKVTTGVLGRNFLHLRDTTGVAPLSNDLAVTTAEDIGVGAEVLLEGNIEIEKDFGSGYRYRVLLADARQVQP